MESKKILIVDDEPDILEFLELWQYWYDLQYRKQRMDLSFGGNVWNV